MTFTPFFLPSLPINRLISSQFLTPSSFSSSTTMCFHRWPFIKRGLFENQSGVIWSVNRKGVIWSIMVSCSLEAHVSPLSPLQQLSYWHVLSAGAIGITYSPINSFRFLYNKIRNSFRFLWKASTFVLYYSYINKMTSFYLCSFYFCFILLFAVILRIWKIKMKKFWKMIVPDFNIRINQENINNAFRKTKSRPWVKVEKNRVHEERHRVRKVKLYILWVTWWPLISLN